MDNREPDLGTPPPPDPAPPRTGNGTDTTVRLAAAVPCDCDEVSAHDCNGGRPGCHHQTSDAHRR